MDCKYSSNSYRHELIGVGIGAALGSILAPPDNRSLGLAVGVIVGGLLGNVWKLWISKRQRSKAGWFGQTFYLVAMGLCIYMLWLAYRTSGLQLTTSSSGFNKGLRLKHWLF